MIVSSWYLSIRTALVENVRTDDVHADSGNLADPNEGSCMAVSAIEGDNAAEHKRESRLFRLS
jgi:hypothetical protein